MINVSDLIVQGIIAIDIFRNTYFVSLTITFWTKYFFTGAYVPLTVYGNIMVDGVLASCFADFPHELAHLMMTPMERFSDLMGLIFGNDAGFSVYVSTARQLGKSVLPDVQYWSN